jgi:hypothetical protein
MPLPGDSSIDGLSTRSWHRSGQAAAYFGQATSEPPPHWRQLVPACFFLLVSVIVMALMVAQPERGQKQVAIVLPPWDGALQAAALVQKAGGQLVDAGGLPNVYIATADRPGFVSALYHAGAWLVINPIAAHGCLSSVRQIQELRHG